MTKKKEEQILDIEIANDYFLIPNDGLAHNPLFAGGVAIMEEIKKELKPEDVMATMGIEEERCFVILNKSTQWCLDVIEKGVNASNDLAKKGF